MSHHGHLPTTSRPAPRVTRCSCVVLRVGGEVDLSNVDQIRALLSSQIERAPHDARIVVECDELTFIDSRGLHMMASLQRSADEMDRLLTWRNVTPSIRRLIEIVALDNFIRFDQP